MKKSKQKIYFDKKTDTLWLLIKKGVEAEHKEIAPGVSVELGENGDLLGIEVLNFSQTLAPKLGIKSFTSPVIAHKIRK